MAGVLVSKALSLKTTGNRSAKWKIKGLFTELTALLQFPSQGKLYLCDDGVEEEDGVLPIHLFFQAF